MIKHLRNIVCVVFGLFIAPNMQSEEATKVWAFRLWRWSYWIYTSWRTTSLEENNIKPQYVSDQAWER